MKSSNIVGAFLGVAIFTLLTIYLYNKFSGKSISTLGASAT